MLCLLAVASLLRGARVYVASHGRAALLERGMHTPVSTSTPTPGTKVLREACMQIWKPVMHALTSLLVFSGKA